MRLNRVAITAGVLPLVAINISYLWAAANGNVEWCIPYIHSCTSISAAGRHLPEILLFQGLMIPSAVLLAIYWWLTCRWLRGLGCRREQLLRTMMAMGFIGTCGLVLYCVALGHIGDLYYTQRRIGVVTFFGLSFLGQLLIIYLLRGIDVPGGEVERTVRLLERSAFVIMVMALVSVVISGVDDELYHRTDDAFEWSFVLLMCLHVIITARLWRLTDFRVRFSSRWG